MSDTHVIVVGGGIVGLSTAWYLRRRGHRVTLLDEGSIGTGCSTGNAGMIALGHPPIPRPGFVGTTLKWMLDPTSPLYIPLRFDPALWRWMWQFRRACTAEHFERSLEVLSALGWATGDCFDEIVTAEGLDCEYRKTGWYDVFASDAGRETAMEDANVLRNHGFTCDELTGAELIEREPAFRDTVLGAVRYGDSAIANPREFVTQLAAALARQGAVVRENVTVLGLRVEDGVVRGVRTMAGTVIEGDAVVLAAGIWTSRLAKPLGIDIPMQAGKGYHLKLTKPDPCPGTACVLQERHVAATPIDGGLQLAGTVEFSGINHRFKERRLDMLLNAARQYLRGIDNVQVVGRWCGLRPCTSDGLPVIGAAPDVEGVWIATGHAKMGFTLGPITGRIIADLITDGETSIDIGLLDPGRWRKGWTADAEGEDEAVEETEIVAGV